MKTAAVRAAIAATLIAGAVPWASACARCEPGPEPNPAEVEADPVPGKGVPPGFPHRPFADPAAALGWIVEKTRPRVIGFGEYHQTDETRGVPSAIARFTGEILPVFSGRLSDLIVETWVSEGGCGESERAVVSRVEEISRRPEETEDENLVLLKRAKALGVDPHILEMGCDDYERVHLADGGIDYAAMLDLVAASLAEETLAALSRRGPGGRMIAVYGGAIHNDVGPEEDFASFSYGPAVIEATGGRYVEVDMYVPRFVLASESTRDEPWYPLFAKLAAEGGTHVVELADNSYIIVL